jgi:hypothetical protein
MLPTLSDRAGHLVALPEDIARTRVANTSEYWRIPPDLEEEYGPGLMAGMNVGHQLHCVV